MKIEENKMKKFIKEMTKDELKKLIAENEGVQNLMIEQILESNAFYVGEILDNLGLLDWSIAPYDYSYVKADKNLFIGGLNTVLKDYGLLYEERERLEKLTTAYEKLATMEYDNKNYDRLEYFVDKEISEFEDMVAGELQNISGNGTDTENLPYEFIERAFDGQFDNWYIKDNDFTTAYGMVEIII